MPSSDTTADAVSAAEAGEFVLAGELPVRRMGFGAMQLPGPGVWGPPKDRARAVSVVRRAVELGVNHIDTSDYYGPYVANEVIREALHPYADDLVIVTKVGAFRTPDQAWPSALKPEQLRRAVYDNLRGLGRDHLDVVNLRIVEEAGGLGPSDSIAEPFGALAELREQGLIRHLGVSNVTAQQFAEAREIAPVVCVQNEYNVVRRRHEDLVRTCAEAGIAFMPFFPLGTFTLQHEKDPATDTKVPRQVPLDAQVIHAVAERHGATAYQVALAWLLRHSANICCIPGTSSPDHLQENIAAAGLRLTDTDVKELDALHEGGDR
ncbi:oxidoreductase [Streptomyces alanosinicus]|uniref:Oxidoreductase n=1 Tax=Streptomyces alanosinicus TaxID=68171 RepID=A0A918YEJ9_9ACTN|nr:oxidoreductase [Streptomyces alanosinicus]GHE01077.1 oxidoreductase [Streptomyces alanosinicus]